MNAKFKMVLHSGMILDLHIIHYEHSLPDGTIPQINKTSERVSSLVCRTDMN